MATVTDEDRAYFYECRSNDRLWTEDLADYRERTEARKDLERDASLAERDKRIASLEFVLCTARGATAKLTAACDEKRDCVANLEHDIGVADKRIGELREQLDMTVEKAAARILDLEAQLAAAKPRMHSEECDEHLVKIERENRDLREQLAATEAARDRAIDKIIEVAAAKPVLTAEEALAVDLIRSRDAHLRDIVALCDLVDAAYTRPKAPPTDTELLAKWDAGGMDHRDIIDALRARGAK